MHSLLDIVNPVVRSTERVPCTQHQVVKRELVMITTDCGNTQQHNIMYAYYRVSFGCGILYILLTSGQHILPGQR